MAKDHLELFRAKETTMANLEVIRQSLLQCVDEGMIDLENVLYNQCLDLMDNGPMIETWGELEELIARAKILEQEVAAWLSLHGRTSISLPWPKQLSQ